jgi:membrane-associated phospholipid phosphatase
MKTRAALWLMLLGPFFFASYGFANWVTSQRQGVPSIAFGWEHSIPFLAWMIVPYWSTDLLYAASLFMCRTRHELDTHAKRLLSVQLLSVTVFLLFPLRFSFQKPAVTGLFGAMFESLMAFDKPFNQAPSLHLGIGAVLWVRYSAHLTGLRRVLLQAWLILAGVSTLTTYQHHFIDLPTGILAGVIAIGLFPMQPNSARRLSAVYLAGSLLCGVAAFRPGELNRLLLWPACALLVPAAAYATRQPAFFGKRNPAMTVLLAPYLAGAWMNSRLGRKPALQHVAADIWIGRAAGRSGYARKGFRSTVDVTAEFPAQPRGSHYRSVPMLDLIPPTPAQLRLGVKAIEDLQDFRPTVVYCALGYSRSAAVIATWLVRSGQATSVEEAIGLIRRCRPQVVLDHKHESAIEEASHGV